MNNCKDCGYWDEENDVAFLDGEVDITRRACKLLSSDSKYDAFNGGKAALQCNDFRCSDLYFITSQDFFCVEFVKSNV